MKVLNEDELIKMDHFVLNEVAQEIYAEASTALLKKAIFLKKNNADASLLLNLSNEHNILSKHCNISIKSEIIPLLIDYSTKLNTGYYEA